MKLSGWSVELSYWLSLILFFFMIFLLSVLNCYGSHLTASDNFFSLTFLSEPSCFAANVSMWATKIDIQAAKVSMWATKIDMQAAKVSMWATKIDMQAAKVGMWATILTC